MSDARNDDHGYNTALMEEIRDRLNEVADSQWGMATDVSQLIKVKV